MKQASDLIKNQIELLKKKEIELLQSKLELIEGLPHLHGWKWYPWAREIFESFNREIFFTAANQASKSSTKIRKNIEWATNPEIWKKAWPHLPPGQKPNQMWYLYPSAPVATVEFETKWEALFLPKGKYKDDPLRGWKAKYERGMITHIKFNSGVTIYFHSYEKDITNLQTGTVFMITLDEECPEEYLPELQARLNATDGYLMSGFTATLGQLYWEKTMEPKSKDDELHPGALKKQISLYDCMFYEDGTRSHWSEEKIERAKARCGTEAEILRRIYGRFVRDEGLRFHGFERSKNITEKHPLPRHWHVYSGVDPGSGGTGHPAGMIFVAVNPDFKQGRVFRAWRGDKQSTTSQDILNRYRALKGDLKPVLQIYDPAAKDFFLVASRQGETFIPAQKDRDSGIGLINVLFKNGMLKIQSGDPELEKLISELTGLSSLAKKTDRKVIDDLSDALRYVVELIPWDFSDHENKKDEMEVLADLVLPPPKSATDLRREWYLGINEENQETDIDQELDFWNEMAGS